MKLARSYAQIRQPRRSLYTGRQRGTDFATSRMTAVADSDFTIAPERLAQRPRSFGEHKLLVYHRGEISETSSIEHTSFEALPSILRAGDLLILNDTKVVPAQVVSSPNLSMHKYKL